MTEYELIDIILRASTMCILFFGLIYTGIQLKLSRKVHQENHAWNRRIESQKIIASNRMRSSTAYLNKEMNFLNIQHTIPLEEILKKIEAKPKIQNEIHKLLNIYEGYARGIFQGIYDEDVIKNAKVTIFLKTYNRLQEYIHHRRSTTGQTLWIEFENLVNKWKFEKSEITTRDQLGA